MEFCCKVEYTEKIPKELKNQVKSLKNAVLSSLLFVVNALKDVERKEEAMIYTWTKSQQDNYMLFKEREAVEQINWQK